MSNITSPTQFLWTNQTKHWDYHSRGRKSSCYPLWLRHNQSHAPQLLERVFSVSRETLIPLVFYFMLFIQFKPFQDGIMLHTISGGPKNHWAIPTWINHSSCLSHTIELGYWRAQGSLRLCYCNLCLWYIGKILHVKEWSEIFCLYLLF